MTKTFDVCVFIARLQPPHKAHLKIVNHALMLANYVIVVYGSYRRAPDAKNPWTDAEREAMLLAALEPEDRERVRGVAVRDYPYQNEIWLAEVHNKVNQTIDTLLPGKPPSVGLVGFKKDASSEYLGWFPQWTYVDTGELVRGASATDIRQCLFFETQPGEASLISGEFATSKTGKELSASLARHDWRSLVPPAIVPMLEDFQRSERFRDIQKDYRYHLGYRASWEKAPYPVTFVTVDCVVVKSSHILLVDRKQHPGKGLYALPGGFVGQDEALLDAAIRELQEETKIHLLPVVAGNRAWRTQERAEWGKILRDSRVFDDPGRSLRGRVLTNAFFFKLQEGGPLPEVRGGDDAARAFWMPLGDLGRYEDRFFEDHVSIIQTFLWQ